MWTRAWITEQADLRGPGAWGPRGPGAPEETVKRPESDNTTTYCVSFTPGSLLWEGWGDLSLVPAQGPNIS